MYIPNPDHRNQTPRKSQWTISIDEEIRCFNVAQVRGWHVNNVGWGLYMPNAHPDWLGVAQDHHTKVFIAKFVSSQHTDTWHGYPADYRRNAHDIPHERVLNSWLQDGIFTPAKIRKITKGQRCSL